MEKITEEALNKALEILNLTSKEVEKEGPAEELSEIQKAEQEFEAAQAKLEALKKPATPAPAEELSKAFKDQFTALGQLIQSKDEEIEELKKAVGEIADLKRFNEELGRRLGMVEKQPMERKSVSAVPVERFEKGGEGTSDGTPEGKVVYSISKAKDRRELANFMASEAIEKARANGEKIEQQEFYKAAQCVELGSLGDTPAHAEKIQKLLASKYNILVTGYDK